MSRDDVDPIERCEAALLAAGSEPEIIEALYGLARATPIQGEQNHPPPTVADIHSLIQTPTPATLKAELLLAAGAVLNELPAACVGGRWPPDSTTEAKIFYLLPPDDEQAQLRPHGIRFFGFGNATDRTAFDRAAFKSVSGRMVSAEIVHERWGQQPEPGTHPLMPLVRAYLRGPVSASTAQGLSVGGLVRQPRVVVRDMLPAREPAPDISVAAVQVDGTPMVTAGPERMMAYRAIRHRDSKQRWLPLPGQPRRESRDPILYALQAFAGDGRALRVPRADVLRLGGIGYAATSKFRVHVNEIAAWLLGRNDLVRLDHRAKRRAIKRADAAILWLRSVAISDAVVVSGVGLHGWAMEITGPDAAGYYELGPPGWWKGRGYRLSGALHAARTGNRAEGLARFGAAVDDLLGGSPQASRNIKTPRLLVGKRGLAGPLEFVSADELLHRAGDSWNNDDARWQLWHRRVAALEQHMVPGAKLHGVAPGGDTFEVVKVQKGGRHRRAGLWLRATARRVEAQRKAEKRQGTDGFDVLPLRRLLGID